MERIKLLLCDDHMLMRKGMISIFEKESWIELVGNVGSGEEAINFVSRTTTDVVLMDIVMFGMSGVEASRWIKEQAPSVKVVLVSGEVTPNYITAGIKAGADGYVLKHSTDDVLLNAIRTVANNEHFFGLDVLSHVMTEVQPINRSQAVSNDKLETAKAFISLFVTGSTIEQIEQHLSLPVNSGKNFCSQLMSQLKLKSMSDMVCHAIYHNLVKVKN